MTSKLGGEIIEYVPSLNQRYAVLLHNNLDYRTPDWSGEMWASFRSATPPSSYVSLSSHISLLSYVYLPN